MRKCLRCGTEMKENVMVKISGFLNTVGINIVEESTFISEKFGRAKVAACPNCGELSFYLDEESTAHIKELK